MKNRLGIAILTMGFSGLVAQMLLLRELLVVFSGLATYHFEHQQEKKVGAEVLIQCLLRSKQCQGGLHANQPSALS